MFYVYCSVPGKHPLLRNCRYVHVPCSGKLLREKTFANFVDLGAFMKVFSTKKGCEHQWFIVHTHTLLHYTACSSIVGQVCLSQYPVCGESTKVFSAKSYISSIRESFLPRKFPVIGTYHVSRCHYITFRTICKTIIFHISSLCEL